MTDQPDRTGGDGEVSDEMLVAAMRAFESMSSVLRYREKDKWHTCDMVGMRDAIKAALAATRDASEGALIGGTNFCGHGMMAAICPKCTPPKPAPAAMRSDNIEHLKNIGENGYCNMTAGEAYKKGFAAALAAPVWSPDGAALPDDVLPCDVHLPPNTYLRKGCQFDAFMTALRARYSFPPEAKVFTLRSGAGAAEPVAWTPYIELPLTFWYKNHRGEEGIRTAFPIGIRFGTTEWHPEAQWLLKAFDRDKQAEREFAMRDMVATPPVRGDREPVAWRIFCTNNGATGYLYTEQLPFEPGPGVRVRREPEPLYAVPVQPVAGEREAEGQVNTIVSMRETEDHDIRFLLRSLGLDTRNQLYCNVVRSFREQIICVAASYSRQAPHSSREK